MTRIPESGEYRLVKQVDENGLLSLPEGAVVLNYTTGLDGSSKIAYLESVDADHDPKSKTTSAEGDKTG